MDFFGLIFQTSIFYLCHLWSLKDILKVPGSHSGQVKIFCNLTRYLNSEFRDLNGVRRRQRYEFCEKWKISPKEIELASVVRPLLFGVVDCFFLPSFLPFSLSLWVNEHVHHEGGRTDGRTGDAPSPSRPRNSHHTCVPDFQLEYRVTQALHSQQLSAANKIRTSFIQ